MSFLNYHHLRYFRAVAKEGSLTRAATHLNLSQSALSIQIRQLEQSLGQPLFRRENKAMRLTEAGQIALNYAETIFLTGEELLDTLQHRTEGRQQVLRVGAVSTLSRNFQIDFLHPLLDRADVELIIRNGSLRDLLVQMKTHTLDVVLSNLPVRRDVDTGWHSHLLAEQAVSLVGPRMRQRKKFQFPEDLRTTPIILPSLDSNVRVAFDLMMEEAGIRPTIAAEVDDMAMLRLLAREFKGVTLVPPVVVQDELKEGTLTERCRIPQLKECFYAITPSRRYPNPLLRKLIGGKKKSFIT